MKLFETRCWTQSRIWHSSCTDTWTDLLLYLYKQQISCVSLIFPLSLVSALKNENQRVVQVIFAVYWLPWLCWLFSSRLFSNLYCMNLSFPELTFIAQNKWSEHWFFYKVHNYLQSPFMRLLCWWIVSNQDIVTIFTAHVFIVIVNES